MNFVKSIFLTVVMAFSAAVAFAQPMEPVTWSSSVEKISEGEYRVDFKASVADGWHMYDLGSVPGSLTGNWMWIFSRKWHIPTTRKTLLNLFRNDQAGMFPF